MPKITELPLADSFTKDDVTVIVQDGVTKQLRMGSDTVTVTLNIASDADVGATPQNPYIFDGTSGSKLKINNTILGGDQSYITIAGTIPLGDYEFSTDSNRSHDVFVNTMAVDGNSNGIPLDTMWVGVTGYKWTAGSVRVASFTIHSWENNTKNLSPNNNWAGILTRTNVGLFGGFNYDEGVKSRYTLSKEQYSELSSELGSVTVHTTAATPQLISGTMEVSNVGTTSIMNQTHILQSVYNNIGSLIEIENNFATGARVRFVDITNSRQIIVFPVGHIIGTTVPVVETITYDTYDSAHCVYLNTVTGQQYYVTNDTLNDTVEFQYSNGRWAVQNFSLEMFMAGAIPWSKIDTTGINLLTTPQVTELDSNIGHVYNHNALFRTSVTISGVSPSGNPLFEQTHISNGNMDNYDMGAFYQLSANFEVGARIKFAGGNVCVLLPVTHRFNAVSAGMMSSAYSSGRGNCRIDATHQFYRTTIGANTKEVVELVYIGNNVWLTNHFDITAIPSYTIPFTAIQGLDAGAWIPVAENVSGQSISLVSYYGCTYQVLGAMVIVTLNFTVSANTALSTCRIGGLPFKFGYDMTVGTLSVTNTLHGVWGNANNTNFHINNASNGFLSWNEVAGQQISGTIIYNIG